MAADKRFAAIAVLSFGRTYPWPKAEAMMAESRGVEQCILAMRRGSAERCAQRSQYSRCLAKSILLRELAEERRRGSSLQQEVADLKAKDAKLEDWKSFAGGQRERAEKLEDALKRAQLSSESARMESVARARPHAHAHSRQHALHAPIHFQA